MELFYLGLKLGLFMSLLRAFVKFEPLQRHGVFLAAFYTLIIAGLSWVFFIAPQLGPQQFVVWRNWEMRLVTLLLPKSQSAPAVIGWRAWQLWLAETFALMAIYYRLLSKFDEGALFWVILILGMGMVVF